MQGKSNETVELNKNHQNRLSCVGLTARLIGKTSSLKAERLSLALFPIRLRSVPARPHRTSKKQKKVKHIFFTITAKK